MPKRRPLLERRGPFTTTLFRYPGKGGWTFAPIPQELAPPVTRPWGRTPVHAVVDDVSWDTSIWRDSKSRGALLAVPARVRGRKGSGDVVTVEFTFDPEEEDRSVAMATTTARQGGTVGQEGASPSEMIDARIAELNDWRGQMLARVRGLIKDADPDVVEEVKWRKPSNLAGVPAWSHDGIICTGETYKNAVKLTFAKGASLDDPSGLFNAGLDGNTRRAIDIHEGDTLDERAFQALVRAAVALNTSARPAAGSRSRSRATGKSAR